MKRSAGLCLWVCLLWVAGNVWGMGSDGRGRVDAAAPTTSLQRIDAAEQAGTIDPDTAVLYRVYSVVDETRLPPEYVGNRPMKDGTGVLRQARSRFDSLRPEIQDQLRPYLFPRGER